MNVWEELLGIRWPKSNGPQSLCDQSGECCRGAAQVAPWQNILKNAGAGDKTARDFLAQYMPYPSRAEAEQNAPDAVNASVAIAKARGDNPAELVFYHCRYLKGKNICSIYEDRPQLCRDFPESPFGTVPACCGYASLAKKCRHKITTLKTELNELKQQQQSQTFD